MIISDTAVRKSTTVLVLALLLIIVGVYSYKVLPRESDPDITIPNVFVSTSYRGGVAHRYGDGHNHRNRKEAQGTRWFEENSIGQFRGFEFDQH